MSKYSAEARWEIHYEDTLCYYCYHPRIGDLFSLNVNRVESLHSIIHEINECEVIHTLLKMGVKDVDTHITHMVSPFGRR